MLKSPQSVPGPPRVSVVIPTYNRAHCVSRAIDSALAQTYSNFEVIVVDDGSKDNTTEVLARYGNRIRAVKQVNQGVSAARNHGTQLAEGDYVAFLDSDDEWFPRKLELQAAYLKSNPDIGFAACLGVVETADDNFSGSDENDPAEYAVYRTGDAQQQFLTFLYSPFPQNMSRYMFRKSVLVEVGGFDRGISGPEDWEMFLKVLRRGIRFGYVPESLVLYHFSEDAISLNLKAMLHGEEVIRRRYIPTIANPLLRWSVNTRMLARRYFSAALRTREAGSKWISARFALQSLIVNPLYPKPSRRVKWLAGLLVRIVIPKRTRAPQQAATAVS